MRLGRVTRRLPGIAAANAVASASGISISTLLICGYLPGVLLTLDGLHPPSMGARVSFAGGKPTVTDGPFIETTEVVGGYWMIDVKSKAEAIAWASRCPMADNEIIEIRQVQ